MKKLLAILLAFSLMLCALPTMAEIGAADVMMEGETYHLTLQSVDIVDGKLTVVLEGFGDTLRWGANGPMVAGTPVARYGGEAVKPSTVNMNVGAAFTFIFERDDLPDEIWMNSYDEDVEPVLIWQADDAETPAASIPEELVGYWRGVGTPKNGGPAIDLSARIEADGSGEYSFVQDDYTEGYPFILSSDDSSFSVDIPADNTLGIARCEGTWALEDDKLKLDITTTFASGGSYSYTAECEKVQEVSEPDAEAAPELLSPEVGDIVTFGNYEQDNNEANGPEEIEWIVLCIKNGGATMISKYALDAKTFSDDEDRLTWDVCTLREWLNGPFIDAAFSVDEQALMLLADVSAERNSLHLEVDPGKDTQDLVYLLGYTEAQLLFESNQARYCKATSYAVAQGAFVNEDTLGTWWHLRSPGRQDGCCAGVDVTGKVSGYGSYNWNNQAIRPVITLRVESPDSPEITPTPTPEPTPSPSPTPSPTPLPEDLAALNALHVQAINESGEAISKAAIDGDVIVAYYTYAGEEAIPRKLTAASEDEWNFPREYRAADYASARWAALIFPTYVNVGFYGQYGPANRTITWLALADLETGKLYKEKIATEEPPRTINVQTINGIPIRTGASGKYHDEDAFARLTELVEAAR